MKKILLATMGVMLLGTSTYAQSPIVRSKGNFYPCIGQLTTSGKAVLISEERVGTEEVKACTYSIYDDQMNITKTFNVVGKPLTYRTWTETAKVVPTGFSYAFYDAESKYENGEWVYYEAFDGNPETIFSDMDFSDVATPEQLVQKLVDAGKLYSVEEVYPFTDFKGNLAFMYGDASYFYYYGCFGAKYPKYTFYTLIDGKIYRIFNPRYGELSYSTDNLVWTIDESTIVERNINCHLMDIDYEDYDNGTDWECTLTQSLFNNDDKWEYCVEEYKVVPIPDEEKYISRHIENEDGTFTVTREGGETCEFDRSVVYNEDGVECLSFGADVDFDDVYRLNGKDYISGEIEDADGEWYGCLWEIDRPANSIREVARTKSSRVKAEKNAVIVEVDEELSGSDVMVADAAGHLMGKGHIKKGSNSARVAMPTHTPGVYVVSLKRGNKVMESHKMLIK